MRRVVAFTAFSLILVVIASASSGKPPTPIVTENGVRATATLSRATDTGGMAATGVGTTTTLYVASFDAGAACTAAGWTTVDVTAPVAEYWHVDDFAPFAPEYAPLDGLQSLWCGAGPAPLGPLCAYASLPGYGNNWNQAFCTIVCTPVVPPLFVTFVLQMDSEPGYDALYLEYTTDCVPPITGWLPLDGGPGVWDGSFSGVAGGLYPIVGPVNLRLRFQSDPAFSDEDGLYDSVGGPVIIDNLMAEAFPVEDFEGEIVGAIAATDWAACSPDGFGNHMALFKGESLVQEDAYVVDLSCQWAAIQNSADNYACGGYPTQAAVPKGNASGQYLFNTVESPPFPLAGVGVGNAINFQFSVYRDLPTDNLVFYIWGVRTIDAIGCASQWRDRGALYGGDFDRWHIDTFPVGDLVDQADGLMQVRLGVVDMCRAWCGTVGTGVCHSHAPLLDNVRIYRVDNVGPLWVARDIDMFQDTFPLDGTASGVGRADMARTADAAGTNSVPGDSVVFTCVDPVTAVPVTNPSGLANDLVIGGKQVYLYVHCSDGTKTGAMLTDSPANYPFKDTVVAYGKTWTRIRCQQTTNPSGTQFCGDLNDALFDGGDVVEFFFGATNTDGETTFLTGSSLERVEADVDVAAWRASEFTVLPSPGSHGILYVDGMDGFGSQAYWDHNLDGYSDRFDVRGPERSAFNRPGKHVVDVEDQLNAAYVAIYWDGGDLPEPLVPDDYAMLNAYLAALEDVPGFDRGGVYLCGNDVAESTIASSSPSAAALRSTYIPFSLTTGNHRPAYGVSPLVETVPGGLLDSWGLGDFYLYGDGDFDVMTPLGTTVVAATYGPAVANNAAVIANSVGNARVVLSGFSLISLRDDEPSFDRGRFQRNILQYLADFFFLPIVDVSPMRATRLEQNYPNPFNPATTIAFSLAEHGRVRVDVFTVSGQRVKTLVDEERGAGSYTDVRWDGTDAGGRPAASGVYFYRLVAGDFSQTRKMVLLK